MSDSNTWGWELALVTTPSNNTRPPIESKLVCSQFISVIECHVTSFRRNTKMWKWDLSFRLVYFWSVFCLGRRVQHAITWQPVRGWSCEEADTAAECRIRFWHHCSSAILESVWSARPFHDVQRHSTPNQCADGTNGSTAAAAAVPEQTTRHDDVSIWCPTTISSAASLWIAIDGPPDGSLEPFRRPILEFTAAAPYATAWEPPSALGSAVLFRFFSRSSDRPMGSFINLAIMGSCYSFLLFYSFHVGQNTDSSVKLKLIFYHCGLGGVALIALHLLHWWSRHPMVVAAAPQWQYQCLSQLWFWLDQSMDLKSNL